MTPWEKTGTVAKWFAVAVIGLFFICALFPLVGEAIGRLLAGWILFLIRVLPTMTIDWPSVVVAVVAGSLLAAGLHAFLRSFRNPASDADLIAIDDDGLMVESSPRWSWRRTAALCLALLAMFAAGICGIGLAHQVVWMVTDEAPIAYYPGAFRVSSVVNLQKIAIGAHNYHDEFDSFPPGGTRAERGRVLHSWQTLLLPYINQKPLYMTIDLSQPWNSDRNADAFRTPLPEYLIRFHKPLPKHDAAGFALSHYSANVLLVGGDRPRAITSIADGSTNTILLGEASSNPVAWGFPANWRDPRLGLNKSPRGFGSPWNGGAQFAFADGSTAFLNEEIDPRVLAALATPDGGDGAELEKWHDDPRRH